MISQDTLTFLSHLDQNNQRNWFEANKNDYLKSKKEIECFVKALESKLNQTDVIEFSKLYRIYRDVRFSKNKLPYKAYFGGYFRRFGNNRRGSYTFEIKPGNQTRVGGGFYGPNSNDLLRIRKEFEMDAQYIQKILTNENFVQHFGTLQGHGVKTAPRGFDKNHPNIELIRKKQFYVFRTFDDTEVLREDFVEQVHETFLAIRPFFDYMTEVLTTDLNGISIID